MGGFLGFGHSSEKTDRGAQLGARSSLWNVFNWALPEGQAQQTTGQGTLSGALKPIQQAQDYFSGLLRPGRTQALQNAAPAVNAAEGQADAARAAEGNFGTSRIGGTAAAQRMASSNTQATIDNLINQNLFQGQQAGAAGLVGTGAEEAAIGEAQLQNSLKLLGLSEDSVKSILGDAASSRLTSHDINKQAQAAWIQAIEGLLTAPATFGTGGAVGGIAG